METDALAGAALEEGIYELLRQRLVQVKTVNTPAVGADWTQQVPAGIAWELLAFTELFTTSAVVANRQVSLQAKDANGNLIGQADAPAVQAASLAKVYAAERDLGQPTAVVVNRFQLPGIDFALTEGMSLNSLTAAIDVGDQHSKIVLVVRQWSLTDVAQAGEWYGRREWPM